MTIRWGILGCGDIVHKRVAQAMIDEPDSQLLAACRRDEAKLKEFCKIFHVPRGYTSDSELLADRDINAVYIATPVHLHLPHTLAAAKAGKHVLVEKPMAMTTAECDEMIAACDKHNVRLGVAYYRRFYPIVRRMKDLVLEGVIGTPLSIAAVTSTPLDLQPGDDGYWRVILKEGGGGALMDVGSHRLNLFLDFFGEVAEVKALCNTLAGDYEAEDTASLILRFESGVHGTLQCFFRTGYTADEFVISGTKGRLIANPLNGDKLIIETASKTRTESHPPPQNLHFPLIEDFVAAILEQHDPLVTGEEGRLTNDVMERAYASAC